jgi:hypothetical protein
LQPCKAFSGGSARPLRAHAHPPWRVALPARDRRQAGARLPFETVRVDDPDPESAVESPAEEPSPALLKELEAAKIGFVGREPSTGLPAVVSWRLAVPILGVALVLLPPPVEVEQPQQR